MRTRPFFTALASAAALGLGADPAAAQQTGTLTLAARTASTVAPVAGNPVRIVASYDVRSEPTATAFPRIITVADSAGAILASVEMAGESRSIPMTVTVIETNLVLQGETREGLLTLVLENQNEGGATRLTTGTWTLGRNSGLLRGRVQP
ncbi:MAG: hypothetical protein U5K74_12060 [Gemmatimonadaceae bacterium]|nr:hypothetical protein [Gemmatimonadaceae bacterium]